MSCASLHVREEIEIYIDDNDINANISLMNIDIEDYLYAKCFIQCRLI